MRYSLQVSLQNFQLYHLALHYHHLRLSHLETALLSIAFQYIVFLSFFAVVNALSVVLGVSFDCDTIHFSVNEIETLEYDVYHKNQLRAGKLDSMLKKCGQQRRTGVYRAEPEALLVSLENRECVERDREKERFRRRYRFTSEDSRS